MTSFILNYFLRGPTAKYSPILGLGLQHMNGGAPVLSPAIPSIDSEVLLHPVKLQPNAQTGDLSMPVQQHLFPCLGVGSPTPSLEFSQDFSLNQQLLFPLSPQGTLLTQPSLRSA